MKLLVTIASLLFINTAHATSFALDTNGGEPLYQTQLTKEVYHYSGNDYLHDLSVTNADGETVPYALVPYKDMHQQTKVTEKSAPLTIFPMQEDLPNQTGITNIQLSNHDSSTSVNVISEENKSISKTYYLFDLGKKHPAFKKLTLDWQGHEGKLLGVDVMTSNNLNDWVNVGEAALLKVTASDQEIIQNSILFDQAITARYLQVRPHEPGDTFELTSVNLEFNLTEEVSLPILWQEIPLSQREESHKKTHIDFESPNRYPATYLNVKLPQKNTITHVSILTRSHKDKPWERVTSASIYRLNKQGNEYANKDIRIPATTARYWRLAFDQAEGGIGIDSPKLSLGWLPDILIWNARGSSPFSLHVGVSTNTANTVSVRSLLNPYSLQKLKQLPASSLSLTSSEQHFNAWQTPTDNKPLWLWAGLLLGVMALAVMALSLVKNKLNK